jgi:3-isopropylmalate dehydrogenase
LPGDSLLFGAAGDAKFPGVFERALILRTVEFTGCHLGVRPAYLHADRLSPLKNARRGDLDCVIVRDTVEGEFVPAGASLHRGTPNEAIASLIMHTRMGVERTLRYAFELATRRRNRLSVVAQSNVLIAHRLWPEVLDELAPAYPQVESELVYADQAAHRLVTNPRGYDVVASTLLLGGILTDLSAATIGGMGLIGSARLNTNTGFGFFEPAHGSAHKYTGLGRVSPIATFNALALLLENLGQAGAAARLGSAVDHVLRDGSVPDATTRSGLNTRQVTDVVLRAIDLSEPPEPRQLPVLLPRGDTSGQS